MLRKNSQGSWGMKWLEGDIRYQTQKNMAFSRNP